MSTVFITTIVVMQDLPDAIEHFETVHVEENAENGLQSKMSKRADTQRFSINCSGKLS